MRQIDAQLQLARGEPMQGLLGRVRESSKASRALGIQGLDEAAHEPDLADQHAIGPTPRRGPQQVARGARQQVGLLAARLKRVQQPFRRIADQDRVVVGC
jgi:hypothetical protein